MSGITLLPDGTPSTVLVGAYAGNPAAPVYFEDTEAGQHEASAWLIKDAQDKGNGRQLFRCQLVPEAQLYYVPPNPGPRLRERDG